MQPYFNLLLITVLISFQPVGIHIQKNKTAAVISNQNTAEEKWKLFWKDFIAAINAKDKEKIAGMTSKDFYDGGGSTVQQWLDAEVFRDDKSLAGFQNILKKGVKNFKGFDPGPYKATGKNRSGDLFFEYKKGKWLFGGVVGD